LARPNDRLGVQSQKLFDEFLRSQPGNFY
jgi:hypothetical protein